MIAREGLPFIQEYISSLNEIIKREDPSKQLSRLQKCWISFVLLGVIVTNTVCWSRIAKFSVESYKATTFSWFFKKSLIAWESLLRASVKKLIENYNIKTCVLVIDDSDIERSRRTKRIAKVHSIRDKKRSGYFKGQNVVFLLLVSNQVTIPVGFRFYEPDPAISRWFKEDKRLRKKGVKKMYRPIKPEINENYPTKIELSLEMLEEFREDFAEVKIKAIIADAAYSSAEFFNKTSSITNQRQVISQIRKTQLVNVNGKFIQVQKFFSNYNGVTKPVQLRFNNKDITFCCIKLKVKSHDKRYRVIALKNEGESEYRYLIAQDTTWRDIDIIKAYALRWLVEVFIQDWKQHEGWNKLAMQRGIDGSQNGLLISLLTDHALHFHHDQITLYKNNQSAATVRSLKEKVIIESLNAFINNIISSDNPRDFFEKYSEKILNLFKLNASIKHLRGVDVSILQNC